MEGAQPSVELKQVLSAIIFAAQQPLSAREIRKVLSEVAANTNDTAAAAYANLKDQELEAALAELRAEWERRRMGFQLTTVAGGYRFQTDPACGLWVRHLLNLGKPVRLSRPALETLAIIAYRQPATRAEIEGVRGVAVDHVLHLLMELQLVRIMGRSDLPGRPMLYGTTNAFLEHFGLSNVKDLPDVEELSRRATPIARPAPQAESVAAVEERAADAAAPAPREEADESQ